MCFLRGVVVGVCLVFGGCGLLASGADEEKGGVEVKFLDDDEGEKYDKMYRGYDRLLVGFSDQDLETSWKYLCPKGYEGPFETCRKRRKLNCLPGPLKVELVRHKATGKNIPRVTVPFLSEDFKDTWRELHMDKDKVVSFLGYDTYFRKKRETTFEIKGVKFIFVKIKGGIYPMGSPDDEKGRYNDEVRRGVKVESFLMGKYPITQAQYKVVMDRNPSSRKGDDYPVTDVSYNDANVFIKKLNNLIKGKLGGRLCLPSEEYWEYAARGGKKTAYWWGNDGVLASIHCWWKGNSGGKVHAVGAEGHENPYGLSDMLGNVGEWTRSHPKEPSKMHRIVVRGGAYSFILRGIRSAYRHYMGCDERERYSGFRLMISFDS